MMALIPLSARPCPAGFFSPRNCQELPVHPAGEGQYNGGMRILLDEIMDQRNMSERQVSDLTGLPRSLVHEIRRGSRPRIDTVEQLAKGLGIRMRDLMESEYL